MALLITTQWCMTSPNLVAADTAPSNLTLATAHLVWRESIGDL